MVKETMGISKKGEELAANESTFSSKQKRVDHRDHWRKRDD